MYMKKIIGISAGLCFLFLNFNILAQQNNWCGSVSIIEDRIKNNPQLALDFELFKATLLANKESEAAGYRAGSDPVYIPVVFHIVHNGDALGVQENITDAQAISQIDAMNRDYTSSNTNTSLVPTPFQSLIADCNIKFCLAKFDESGNITTGVIRHQFTNTTWNDENDIDGNLKPATIWDPSKYLNIWSINMGGSLASSGVLAYSSFPGFGAADADGIVVRYNALGTTGNMAAGLNTGKTISHEVGHWLSLLHVWGFDDGCNDIGDFIDDTPDQGDLNFGCPTFPSISCTNGPNGDMFMNHMDYSDDVCRVMFTLGQSARMQSTLNGSRISIKTAASQCFYATDAAIASVLLPSDTVCSLSFQPYFILKNEGNTFITSAKIYMQLDGGTIQIINWAGNLALQQKTDINLPAILVAQGNHTLVITVGDINASATDNFTANNTRTISFYAYDGGPANATPFMEDFETIFPTQNWSVTNPNSDVTWVQNTTAGGYLLSASSVSINNKSYATIPIKKKDGLITDNYDLSALNYPELKFDVAYAQYNNNRADSLNVYYSLDCGQSWIKVWNQRGKDLATAPNNTSVFIPNDTQWKTIVLPLLFIGGRPKVTFKFENVSGWGNTLYLDNINLTNNTALAINEVEKVAIKIMPNPATDKVAVRLPINHTFKTISVLNNMGQVVYQAPCNNYAILFSVANWANGIYFIQLQNNQSIQTEKLIISNQ